MQVLYPLGVGSELAMVALAMPTIRANRPLSIQVGTVSSGTHVAAPAAIVCYAEAMCENITWLQVRSPSPILV